MRGLQTVVLILLFLVGGPATILAAAPPAPGDQPLPVTSYPLPVVDIALTAISTPEGAVEPGTLVDVSAAVVNRGERDLFNVSVALDVDGQRLETRGIGFLPNARPRWSNLDGVVAGNGLTPAPATPRLETLVPVAGDQPGAGHLIRGADGWEHYRSAIVAGERVIIRTTSAWGYGWSAAVVVVAPDPGNYLTFLGVMSPSVVYHEGTYWMYYIGQGTRSADPSIEWGRLMRAQSVDGLVWTNHTELANPVGVGHQIIGNLSSPSVATFAGGWMVAFAHSNGIVSQIHWLAGTAPDDLALVSGPLLSPKDAGPPKANLISAPSFYLDTDGDLTLGFLLRSPTRQVLRQAEVDFDPIKGVMSVMVRDWAVEVTGVGIWTGFSGDMAWDRFGDRLRLTIAGTAAGEQVLRYLEMSAGPLDRVARAITTTIERDMLGTWVSIGVRGDLPNLVTLTLLDARTRVPLRGYSEIPGHVLDIRGLGVDRFQLQLDFRDDGRTPWSVTGVQVTTTIGGVWTVDEDPPPTWVDLVFPAPAEGQHDLLLTARVNGDRSQGDDQLEATLLVDRLLQSNIQATLPPSGGGWWQEEPLANLAQAGGWWFGDPELGVLPAGGARAGRLVIPGLDLRGLQSPALEFTSRLQTANSQIDLTLVHAVVEARPVGSPNWVTMTTLREVSPTAKVVRVPLDTMAGKLVDIGFRYESYRSLFSDYYGWGITDIALHSAGPATGLFPAPGNLPIRDLSGSADPIELWHAGVSDREATLTIVLRSRDLELCRQDVDLVLPARSQLSVPMPCLLAGGHTSPVTAQVLMDDAVVWQWTLVADPRPSAALTVIPDMADPTAGKVSVTVSVGPLVPLANLTLEVRDASTTRTWIWDGVEPGMAETLEMVLDLPSAGEGEVVSFSLSGAGETLARQSWSPIVPRVDLQVVVAEDVSARGKTTAALAAAFADLGWGDLAGQTIAISCDPEGPTSAGHLGPFSAPPSDGPGPGTLDSSRPALIIVDEDGTWDACATSAIITYREAGGVAWLAYAGHPGLAAGVLTDHFQVADLQGAFTPNQGVPDHLVGTPAGPLAGIDVDMADSTGHLGGIVRGRSGTVPVAWRSSDQLDPIAIAWSGSDRGLVTAIPFELLSSVDRDLVVGRLGRFLTMPYMASDRRESTVWNLTGSHPVAITIHNTAQVNRSFSVGWEALPIGVVATPWAGPLTISVGGNATYRSELQTTPGVALPDLDLSARIMPWDAGGPITLAIPVTSPPLPKVDITYGGPNLPPEGEEAVLTFLVELTGASPQPELPLELHLGDGTEIDLTIPAGLPGDLLTLSAPWTPAGEGEVQWTLTLDANHSLTLAADAITSWSGTIMVIDGDDPPVLGEVVIGEIILGALIPIRVRVEDDGELASVWVAIDEILIPLLKDPEGGWVGTVGPFLEPGPRELLIGARDTGGHEATPALYVIDPGPRLLYALSDNVQVGDDPWTDLVWELTFSNLLTPADGDIRYRVPGYGQGQANIALGSGGTVAATQVVAIPFAVPADAHGGQRLSLSATIAIGSSERTWTGSYMVPERFSIEWEREAPFIPDHAVWPKGVVWLERVINSGDVRVTLELDGGFGAVADGPMILEPGSGRRFLMLLPDPITLIEDLRLTINWTATALVGDESRYSSGSRSLVVPAAPRATWQAVALPAVTVIPGEIGELPIRLTASGALPVTLTLSGPGGVTRSVTIAAGQQVILPIPLTTMAWARWASPIDVEVTDGERVHTIAGWIPLAERRLDMIVSQEDGWIRISLANPGAVELTGLVIALERAGAPLSLRTLSLDIGASSVIVIHADGSDDLEVVARIPGHGALAEAAVPGSADMGTFPLWPWLLGAIILGLATVSVVPAIFLRRWGDR